MKRFELKLLRPLLVCLFVFSFMPYAMAGSGIPDKTDTLRFRFLLYGQTQRINVGVAEKADTLFLNWSMKSYLVMRKGRYAMPKDNVESGNRLFFDQPEAGKTIVAPHGSTAFMISKSAYGSLKKHGMFSYGGVDYRLVDTLRCSQGVGSLHVRDSVEGGEMWIADNADFPLIWKMKNNPLGIDWVVDNAGTVLDKERKKLRVAFISDPHVMDVENHPEYVRTVASEILSTRLFNADVFALRAALDDAVSRGIRLVVLSGDLTDDGQVVNLRAVKAILGEYSSRYGMDFFVTTGNHDPSRPFGRDVAVRGFIAEDGSDIARASSEQALASLPKGTAAVVDTLLRCGGYREVTGEFSRFGFFPKRNYRYWATPFSTYSYGKYSFEKAVAESSLEKRRYALCDTLLAQDASYVVEPVHGLWLLSIDGGVYLPEGSADGKVEYAGAAVGYALTYAHKQFLFDWIRRVASEARRLGKKLVAFSHYPAADFNGGATPLIRDYWGEDKFDLHRVPPAEVAEALADAGIRLHVAGHIHQNHTAVTKGKSGKSMYSLQTPSTAFCIPAYKILTFEDDGSCRVQTVTVDSVQGLQRLLPSYMKEYAHLQASGRKPWNVGLLYALADYRTFCKAHFTNIVDKRFVPRDLPKAFADTLRSMDGRRLTAMVCGTAPDSVYAWGGEDLLVDLYRLHYAGGLALREIPKERLAQYGRLLSAAAADTKPRGGFALQLGRFMQIFGCMLHCGDDVDFVIPAE